MEFVGLPLQLLLLRALQSSSAFNNQQDLLTNLNTQIRASAKTATSRTEGQQKGDVAAAEGVP